MLMRHKAERETNESIGRTDEQIKVYSVEGGVQQEGLCNQNV